MEGYRGMEGWRDVGHWSAVPLREGLKGGGWSGGTVFKQKKDFRVRSIEHREADVCTLYTEAQVALRPPCPPSLLFSHPLEMMAGGDVSPRRVGVRAKASRGTTKTWGAGGGGVACRDGGGWNSLVSTLWLHRSAVSHPAIPFYPSGGARHPQTKEGCVVRPPSPPQATHLR